jgi:CHAT domain-containing protein
MELGVVHLRLNQPEKAIGLYEQALPIFREVKSRNYEGLTLFRMGESKLSMRRTDEAVGLLAESVTIFHAIGSRNFEFGALTGLAKAERDRGNIRQALAHVEASLKIAESLRADLMSPEFRTSLLAGVQDSYQVYTDLLMRQHRAEPSKGLDALAFEVSERQRARSLLDLLSEARADVRQGVDPALIERERALAKQLNDKAQRLTQASNPEQAAAFKQEISQLETELERAQAAIRKASPHYAALTQPQPLKLGEIQAQLDADTLLLEYSLGQHRSYLWAITRDSLSSYELPEGEVIDKQARQLYELLTARSTSRRGESPLERQQRITQAEAALPAAAAALSETLLSPVASKLANKRLVVVADAALQYIPFAMLPDPGARRMQATHQPLIVNHEVVSLPSASALAVQRAELANRKVAAKLLAVIADPVFDRGDERLTATVTEGDGKQQADAIAFDYERSLEHLADKSDEKPGTTRRRVVIPRLPFTRQEATRLLALAPKQSSFGAMDFQANRETVLSGELSQYRYVHFATHGMIDSQRPGLSALVLSMVDEQGKGRDGFLRANDIYNLRLGAELVVLSACQTGLGKEIKGEGLVGLTRGFMYAGGARIVVSLWNVNDRATAELMMKFYERMLKRGERAAAALRAAQVEMWRLKQWQSPYYWAAFTLQGEWR